MIRLEVSSLEKKLRDTDRSFVLRVPHFAISGGEKVAIVGTTGSGKTTMMDLFAMTSRADACDLFVLQTGNKRHDLSKVSASTRRSARLRAAHFGYVMQKNPLFPFLTVWENVSLQQDISSRIDTSFISELLERLNIAAITNAFPTEISQGQKQRTAIARALAHRPSLVLCDEPTGALDPTTARICLETIDWAAKSNGAAQIMITHDWQLAKDAGFEFCHLQASSKAEGHLEALLDKRSYQGRPLQ